MDLPEDEAEPGEHSRRRHGRRRRKRRHGQTPKVRMRSSPWQVILAALTVVFAGLLLRVLQPWRTH